MDFSLSYFWSRFSSALAVFFFNINKYLYHDLYSRSILYSQRPGATVAHSTWKKNQCKTSRFKLKVNKKKMQRKATQAWSGDPALSPVVFLQASDTPAFFLWDATHHHWNMTVFPQGMKGPLFLCHLVLIQFGFVSATEYPNRRMRHHILNLNLILVIPFASQVSKPSKTFKEK